MRDLKSFDAITKLLARPRCNTHTRKHTNHLQHTFSGTEREGLEIEYISEEYRRDPRSRDAIIKLLGSGGI